MKILLLAFITLLAPATDRIEKYYDWNWRDSDAEHARFLCLMQKVDSGWERKDYFIHERSLQMMGHYTDTSCKVAHGDFVYYHPNGLPQSSGRYINGKREGIWMSWHSNAMLSDSAMYVNGQVAGTSLAWHANGYLSDSSVYAADGSGISIRWFDNGAPSSAGRYSAGFKKSGRWQYFHKNGNPSAIEVYSSDKLVNRQYFAEDGAVINDTSSRDHAAIFKKGNTDWQNYLLKQTWFPDQYKITNADAAVVVIDAVVDEDGNITEAEVSTPLHKAFDKIALDAVKNSPKWSPAIDHNRRVKYKIRQAITFQQ